MKDDVSFPSTSYTALSVSDHEEGEPFALSSRTVELTEATAVDAVQDLYVDRPVKTVRRDNGEYSNLKELQHLTWTDTFFDEEDDNEDIIAVFDFDYDAMEDFYTKTGWVAIGATLLYTPLFMAQLIGLAPCFLRDNVRWNARAQHVAVTRDGIRFVRDRRPCCWGLPCTDQGKSSKTVPFDKITDCAIQEPAGNTCFCVTNVLTTVKVDTASSGGSDGRRKELEIAGLKNPHGFRKLVLAMKRQQQGQNHGSGLGASTNTAAGGEEMTSLLREIRDELRHNNELLQKQKSSTIGTATTAESSVI